MTMWATLCVLCERVAAWSRANWINVILILTILILLGVLGGVERGSL